MIIMKKYTTPIAKAIMLFEENDLMFVVSGREATENVQYSNHRDEKESHGSSIWDND